MYRILVVGAGYVGAAVAQHFQAKKQKVWVTTRSEARAADLQSQGIAPIVCDLNHPETFQKIPDVHFVIIAVAPDERSEASYREVYLKGVGNLLAHLKGIRRPELVVYVSSTGVYRDRDGEWVDEKTAPEPDSERGRILLAAEEQVLRSGYPACVLRLAGIYGPGRNRIQQVLGGQKSVEEDGYMNLIHRDDIVEMMPQVLKSAEAGQVYLGVDDEPVLKSEFYKWLCERLQKSAPELKKNVKGGKRCANQKLKALGIKLRYPTFREGYEKMILAKETMPPAGSDA